MRRILRYLLATVLLVAGGGKLLDLPGFVLVLRSYGIFPKVFLWPMALAVTGAELSLSLWLITGWRVVRAAAASITLHSLYAAWALFMLLRGKPILNCGCFGSFLVRPLSWMTVAEDLVLVACSIALYKLARRQERSAG